MEYTGKYNKSRELIPVPADEAQRCSNRSSWKAIEGPSQEPEPQPGSSRSVTGPFNNTWTAPVEGSSWSRSILSKEEAPPSSTKAIGEAKMTPKKEPQPSSRSATDGVVFIDPNRPAIEFKDVCKSFVDGALEEMALNQLSFAVNDSEL